MVILRALRSIALVVFLTASAAAADGPPENQIIVKFSGESDAGRTAVDAMDAGVESNQAVLALAQSLSEQLGTQIYILQVTSGRELVLGADSGTDATQLIERLQLRDDVEYVQPNALMQPQQSSQ